MRQPVFCDPPGRFLVLGISFVVEDLFMQGFCFSFWPIFSIDPSAHPQEDVLIPSMSGRIRLHGRAQLKSQVERLLIS